MLAVVCSFGMHARMNGWHGWTARRLVCGPAHLQGALHSASTAELPGETAACGMQVLDTSAPVAAADGALEDMLEAAVVLANIAMSTSLAARAASVAQTAGLHLRASFLRLTLSTCCDGKGLHECAPASHVCKEVCIGRHSSARANMRSSSLTGLLPHIVAAWTVIARRVDTRNTCQ